MKIYDKEYESREEFIRTGRRCGTPDPTTVILERVNRNRSAFRPNSESLRDPSQQIDIAVRFVHILDGDTGRVSDAQRNEQIAVLNSAYELAGVSFKNIENDVTEIDNAAWFNAGPQTAEEIEMKSSTVESPGRQLNFITSSAGGLLGWASFPW